MYSIGHEDKLTILEAGSGSKHAEKDERMDSKTVSQRRWSSLERLKEPLGDQNEGEGEARELMFQLRRKVGRLRWEL